MGCGGKSVSNGDAGAGTLDGGVPDGFIACGDGTCVEGVCYNGVCVPTYGTCIENDDCGFDSFCEGGVCYPYGAGTGKSTNEDCSQAVDIEAILPSEQCRWTGQDDPEPDAHHVMVTPVVVDFRLDGDLDGETLAPSIVFPSFPGGTSGGNSHYRRPAFLRIVDGETCDTQFSLTGPGDEVMGAASVAVADLDGDGRAEIVASAWRRGLIAFHYNEVSETFEKLWHSDDCAVDPHGEDDQWAGPSVYDLDDDGTPEILFSGVVYDAQGCVLDATSVGYVTHRRGLIPVVADVDEDGSPEVIFDHGIFSWNTTTQMLDRESYSPSNVATGGQVAVAEMGDFPVTLPVMGQDYPELVVVKNGQVFVKTLDGQVVFGPLGIPGGGVGGAPTVADFDGDGRAEFATAGGAQYAVFDLDCEAPSDVETCASGSTNGVLWSQSSQDNSSNVTGSSVFDFDADGAAEVVYADECFLRVYNGKTGEVLYSAARSSGTAYENPVIADVDGDFRTEIVVPTNDYVTVNCPTTDPLLSTTTYERSHGIVVLRDVQDRWAASRPVWNQHAYSVTHVGDYGETIKSSEVERNWDTEGLNNFRQNVQGDVDALGNPDATSSPPPAATVACNGGVATLEARICNRGTLPMGSGMVLSFRDGSATGTELCRDQTSIVLSPGVCETLSCAGTLAAGATTTVFMVADPDSTERECLEGNNFSSMDVTCSGGVI